jgi:branched-chain amino acid transport system substrate-binding protein
MPRPRPLALALAVLVLTVGPASARQAEVVVGLLYPLTGPTAWAAIDERHAFELFADMVNGKEAMPPGRFYQNLQGLRGVGGGARLRLVFVDHQGKPDLGQSAAERLILQEKVHALIGAGGSSVTATASQVAERFAVPFLTADSDSPRLTRRGFKWLFRASPHDEHSCQAVFDFMADLRKRKGVKLESVAITYEESAFGADLAKVERTLAVKYGYTIVADFPYRASSAAPTAEVQTLKQANPDVWLTTLHPSDAARFTRAARERDWSPRLVVARTADPVDPSLTQPARAADGFLSGSSFPSDRIDRNPVAKALNGPYRARSGKDLYDLPARAFTGIATLVDAINRAGSTEPEAVRKALAATDVKPVDLLVPWTGVRFDETGQNTGVRVTVAQLQGGKYHTVWPFEMATRELLYPIPAWSERK